MVSIRVALPADESIPVRTGGGAVSSAAAVESRSTTECPNVLFMGDIVRPTGKDPVMASPQPGAAGVPLSSGAVQRSSGFSSTIAFSRVMISDEGSTPCSSLRMDW